MNKVKAPTEDRSSVTGRSNTWNSKLLNRRRASRINIPAIFTAIVIVALWEIGARADERNVIPSPSGMLAALPSTLTDIAFWGPLGSTLGSVLLGMIIGVGIGIILGLLVGRSSWIRSVLNPYISGLNAMPILAIIPLATIWLGYTDMARLSLVILSCALPVIISTADGAARVPKDLEDAMDVIRVGEFRKLRDLVLPSTIPFVVAGVNVGIGRAIIAAVSVEFVASVSGIGIYILTNARSFNQDESFLGVIAIAIMGLLIRFAAQVVTKLAVPWYSPAEVK